MIDYKKEMGQRIKTRRKKLMLTQEVISEQLNISVKHLSEVERGIAGLSIENLIKLSNTLGLSLDYIIKGEADETCRNGASIPLKNVPKEKEELLNELIKIGIELTK